MSFSTADLSDQHPDALIADPGLSDFGGVRRFAGPIRTVRCIEDNSLVRVALEGPGNGAVLVVDGGGSLRCALLGDQLGTLAMENGWSGVIVNGCVRDSADLGTMDLGVKALATHPRKSVKRGEGERDVAVSFLGVEFSPGAMVYADGDGVVVA
ncbi:MAG TPA: ribonuclease E activity regulator RraA [Acidimicrobiia bacterium]|jgi:regulator of ribonuclease activity A|nr:ribonuclease E activity regulator RraA [Acidimicrobiia bacterium]